MALYGFLNLQDVAAARISAGNIEAVNDAINASVAEHNRALAAVMALFVQPTTEYTGRFAQVGNTRLQPLDNNGRALPVKPAGYYDVAWPIIDAGVAWGANFVTRELMTVGDAERITAMMLQADATWMRDHILGALFATASYNFVDPLYGTLAIQPLASGDSVTYGIVGTSPATDTHQIGQAAAIADASNPFPVIRTELIEHPENAGDVVVFIASANRTAVEALATFHPIADGNVQRGSGSDVLVGSLGTAVPGELIGYEDSGVWVVEWKAVPADYQIGVTTAGTKPLRMREYPAASLQGFTQVATRDDHPFYESHWERHAGFGAYSRIGAVVSKVSDATYDVPTGFTTPMP